MAQKTNVQQVDQRTAALQANAQARAAILQSGLNMTQQIYANTVTTGIPGQVFNIPLRNVGLVKRLWLRIDATVQRAAVETQTRTKFGAANLISNIILTDLSNQQRINTTGWHLHMIASAKRSRAFGAAYANDSPNGIGSNYAVNTAPAAFQAGQQTIRQYFEVPIAYSDRDLRGAIYASTVNATWQLQFTINPNFFVGSAADATLAGYQSSTAGDLGTFVNLTATLHQNYIDQIPMGRNGPILPMYDLSTAYLLNNTVKTNIVANQDNPIPYANFREFQSTCIIYDQAGVLNPGTDINAWKLEAANFTDIFNVDPFLASLWTRNIMGDDFGAGVYYFDHRAMPINTIQYGNMQLILNPSTAAAGSQAFIAFESLALINQITQAGSLYANN